MAYFLLKQTETYTEHQTFTHHIIEAADEQMVKYWWHKAKAEYGFRQASRTNKHYRENLDLGRASEIEEIRELSPLEWDVLSDHLHSWGKP